MRLHKCSFCSKTIYPGYGATFVRNDGRVFRFCTSKCTRNFKLKRNPRKVKWTKAYRHTQGKDMVTDTTYDFERRRNVAVRYNRDVYMKTIKAMKRVAEIQHTRQIRHIEDRKRQHMTNVLRFKTSTKEGAEQLIRSLAVDQVPKATIEERAVTQKWQPAAKERPLKPVLKIAEQRRRLDRIRAEARGEPVPVQSKKRPSRSKKADETME
eukprot:gnl/Dysnectes_brevis/800_a882_5243.p1 GENE.gnl/Dysnectes_brevis/800_a882_5243~~gnl/Dysnectes_brevis/800_a882_5243.p1  ORF type:complete len:210 (+),score=37.41 gnl/Dysnectes_brevis/800_a882_5243:38-667(+)